MVSEALTGVVQEFARRTRQAFGERVLDVRLFGSYARGEAHEWSDVDVFVLLDEAAWGELTPIYEAVSDLFIDSGFRIAPLVLPKRHHDELVAHERRIARDIRDEGISF